MKDNFFNNSLQYFNNHKDNTNYNQIRNNNNHNNHENKSFIQFTNKKNGSNNFLGKKRHNENNNGYANGNGNSNGYSNGTNILKSGKMLKILSKSENDGILNKKIEFKLSHVLQGENTKLNLDIADIKNSNNSNASKNSQFYNDSYIDGLLTWKKSERIGPGFYNLGNTCFLNSVLQSLLYTPALKNYFSLSQHIKICKVKGICFLCEFGRMINIMCKQYR